MSHSRTDPFGHMEHTAHSWLADVAEGFGTKDRRFAYRVLRAWLHTLRDRLTVDSAALFAAQLPEVVRGVYYEGWSPSRVPVKYDHEEFVDRFAAEANVPPEEVPSAVARVTAAMGEHLSEGQLDHVLAQLPEWLRGIVAGDETPAGSDDGHGSTPGEDRIGRLEAQVTVLSEAVKALVHGLEDRPDAEPDEHRVGKAARQAHELLLSTKV